MYVRALQISLSLLQLVLMQEGVAASAGGLLRGGEACQGNDLDGVLLLTTAVSIQGVVELWPIDHFANLIFFGHRPAQGVTTIHDAHAAHVSFGSMGKALLEAKRRHCSSDGGGGRGRCGAVATGTLELGQGWGHPAAVRVAQYQTLLGTGLRGLGQGFLQVYLDGCNKKKKTTL